MASVGQAISAAAGAVAGFFISGFNPMGAIIGFSIGFQVGGVVFPPKPSQEPNRHDFQYNTWERGTPVAVVYGRCLIGGQLLFLGKVTPVESEIGNVDTPKGQDAPTETHYKIDAAIGLCEGAIRDVEKVYLNNVDQTSLEGPNYTVYLGTTLQTVAAQVTAAKVEDPVPWRRLAYLMWHGDIGTSSFLPQISALVVGRVCDKLQTASYASSGDTPARAFIDAASKKVYYTVSAVTDASRGLYRRDRDGANREVSVPPTAMASGTVGKAWYWGTLDILVMQDPSNLSVFYFGRWGLSAGSTEWVTVDYGADMDFAILGWHIDELSGFLYTVHKKSSDSTVFISRINVDTKNQRKWTIPGITYAQFDPKAIYHDPEDEFTYVYFNNPSGTPGIARCVFNSTDAARIKTNASFPADCFGLGHAGHMCVIGDASVPGFRLFDFDRDILTSYGTSGDSRETGKFYLPIAMQWSQAIDRFVIVDSGNPGGSATGAQLSEINNTTSSTTEPQNSLCIGDDKTVYMVYSERDSGGTYRTYYKRKPFGGAWTAAIRVDTARNQTQVYPRIFLDRSTGRLHILYRNGNVVADGFVLYTDNKDAGTPTFSASVALISGGFKYDQLELTGDHLGNLFVGAVKLRTSSARGLYFYTYAGGVWNPVEKTAWNFSDLNGTIACYMNSNTMMIVFHGCDLFGSNPRLSYVKSSDGGTVWTAEQVIQTLTNDSAGQANKSITGAGSASRFAFGYFETATDRKIRVYQTDDFINFVGNDVYLDVYDSGVAPGDGVWGINFAMAMSYDGISLIVAQQVDQASGQTFDWAYRKRDLPTGIFDAVVKVENSAGAPGNLRVATVLSDDGSLVYTNVYTVVSSTYRVWGSDIGAVAPLAIINAHCFGTDWSYITPTSGSWMRFSHWQTPMGAVVDYVLAERYGMGMDPELVDLVSAEMVEGYCHNYIWNPGIGAHEPRYLLDYSIIDRAKHKDHVRAMLSVCQAFPVEIDGRLKFVAERAFAPLAMTITEDHTGASSLSFVQAGRIDRPNVLRVEFLNKDDKTQPYRKDYAEQPDAYNQRISREVREETVSIVGVSRYSHAKRLSKFLLFTSANNRYTVRSNLIIGGELLQISDLVDIVHPITGNVAKRFRVAQMDELGNGDFSIGLVEHNRRVYLAAHDLEDDDFPAQSLPPVDPISANQLTNVGRVAALEMTDRSAIRPLWSVADAPVVRADVYKKRAMFGINFRLYERITLSPNRSYSALLNIDIDATEDLVDYGQPLGSAVPSTPAYGVIVDQDGTYEVVRAIAIDTGIRRFTLERGLQGTTAKEHSITLPTLVRAYKITYSQPVAANIYTITDVTTEVNSSGTNLDILVNEGDYLLLGSDTPFNRANINLAVTSNDDLGIEVWYPTNVGGTLQRASCVVDDTDGMRSSGAISWDAQPDWIKVSKMGFLSSPRFFSVAKLGNLPDTTPRYYILIRRTARTVSVKPKESLITIEYAPYLTFDNGIGPDFTYPIQDSQAAYELRFAAIGIGAKTMAGTSDAAMAKYPRFDLHIYGLVNQPPAPLNPHINDNFEGNYDVTVSPAEDIVLYWLGAAKVDGYGRTPFGRNPGGYGGTYDPGFQGTIIEVHKYSDGSLLRTINLPVGLYTYTYDQATNIADHGVFTDTVIFKIYQINSGVLSLPLVVTTT